MPVVRSSKGALGPDNRPPWCAVTSAGVFRVAQQGGRFDRHYHDCNEYWLIFKGEALVSSEGRQYLVEPGDIVCTKAGDEHDVLEVGSDLEAFWFEDVTPPGGRIGHLHRDAEAAKGHEVKARPRPEEREP
jgi:mannose-6-phosphate isomerase-like protein (cupin superfamily)